MIPDGGDRNAFRDGTPMMHSPVSVNQLGENADTRPQAYPDVNEWRTTTVKLNERIRITSFSVLGIRHISEGPAIDHRALDVWPFKKAHTHWLNFVYFLTK